MANKIQDSAILFHCGPRSTIKKHPLTTSLQVFTATKRCISLLLGFKSTHKVATNKCENTVAYIYLNMRTAGPDSTETLL